MPIAASTLFRSSWRHPLKVDACNSPHRFQHGRLDRRWGQLMLTSRERRMRRCGMRGSGVCPSPPHNYRTDERGRPYDTAMPLVSFS